MNRATAAAYAPATPRTATRGRPVWTLALMIAGWVMLRAATWQPGLPDHAHKPKDASLAAHRSDAPVVARAVGDGNLLVAASSGDAAGPMPGLPPDLRAGLSPEVADQVARELPRELAHQLAIETAREMAKAMAPGLAQRLLHERGLDRLVPLPARAAPAYSGTARPSGVRYAVRQAAPRRGRIRQSSAAGAPPSDGADYQSFRLAAGQPVEPAGTATPPATLAASPPRKVNWLAMLPELLLHPARARQTLAQNGRSINPSPRFSADAWFLQRGGNYASALPTTPLVAGTPGYGGSQSGAVLRYRLFLQDPHRLSVFLRATSATNTPDREATLGLAARPFGSIPIVLQAEARLQNDGSASRLRPAVQAVSQFPPISLPLGLRGEAYVAGGYVGGRGATPFYDAQGVVDHHVLGIGQSADVRIGGGAWAGGQKGVGRVDVGPRASVTFRVKRVGVRAAVDYRARVAGHAAPGSGPALTLSAGF